MDKVRVTLLSVAIITILGFTVVTDLHTRNDIRTYECTVGKIGTNLVTMPDGLINTDRYVILDLDSESKVCVYSEELFDYIIYNESNPISVSVYFPNVKARNGNTPLTGHVKFKNKSIAVHNMYLLR